MNITEVKKDPFRVFSKIEQTWRTYTFDDGEALHFFVRPMKTIERSEYNAAEREFIKSKDLPGAYSRAGLSFDEVHAEKAPIELWRRVSDAQIVDIDAEIAFEQAIRKMIVNCVSKVRGGEEIRDFDADLYDSINDTTILIWLADQIKKDSTLHETETLGL